MTTKTLPPDPDCFQCRGLGTFARGLTCECTLICDCGEERPDGVRHCAHPGCETRGCDSCGEIEWCCDPDDEADGEYFCEEHRS